MKSHRLWGLAIGISVVGAIWFFVGIKKRKSVSPPELTSLLAENSIFGVGDNEIVVPTFDGSALPIPPHENEPWKAPPTTLPSTLLSATDLLFQQGMADPRGCEYRNVKVITGNVWSGYDGYQEVHAWVFPPDASGTTTQLNSGRFAVCWNGLVYPAVSVGEPADLHSDIESLLDAHRQAQNKQQKQDEPWRYFTVNLSGAIPEHTAIDQSSFCQIKTCLLLRLGDTALAETVWAEFNGRMQGMPATRKSQIEKTFEDDPYFWLASEWAWMAFDRAVCAHMRGDDVVSRDTAHILSDAQPKIENTAAARNFERPIIFTGPSMNQRVTNAPYLGFLGQLPDLFEDEKRRVQEGKVDRVLQHPNEYKDKSQQITGLIRDLENDSARQWGQPGGVGLDGDAIPMALEKEGLDAVPALIDCLAKDTRLTRAVSFGRDFAQGRNLLPVSQAAYLTLCHILKISQFGPLTTRGWNPDPLRRAPIVAEIAGYWNRNKGMTPQDRWFQTLADDNADPKQWLEAASRIVQPEDVDVRAGWVSTPARKPGEVPPMQGESLRARKNPSVADLMAKRVPQIAANDSASSNEIFFADDAARVALDLAQWDIHAAIPVLKAQILEIDQVKAHWRGSNQEDMLVRDQAKMSSALQDAGASSANHDYAVWIRALSVPEMPSDDRIFQPIWQNPNDPEIAATADWLFNDPASPWHCLPLVKSTFTQNDDLIISPLIGVAAFEKSVLSNLNDKTVIGECWLHGGLVTQIGNRSTSRGIYTAEDDPLAPKPDEKRTVRVCDWYAQGLSRLEGSPEFEEFWPQENRDAAIASYAAFIHDWADRFVWNDLQKLYFNPPFNPTRMIFPQRDRPASQAEVDAHTAIFSIVDAGRVRAVPIQPFPAEANWITLKRFVVHGQTYDATTKSQKITTQYDQKGWIWQAEEQWANGKWNRYYGFVGNHVVAKVPAEEIEFIEPPSPSAATRP